MTEITSYLEGVCKQAIALGDRAPALTDSQLDQLGHFLTELRKTCIEDSSPQLLDNQLFDALPAHIQQQLVAWCEQRDRAQAQ